MVQRMTMMLYLWYYYYRLSASKLFFSSCANSTNPQTWFPKPDNCKLQWLQLPPKVVIQDPSPYFCPMPGPAAISIPGFRHRLPIPAPAIKQALQLLGPRYALSLAQRALPSSSQLLSADRGWVRMLYHWKLYRMKGDIYGNRTVEWDNQPLKYCRVLALGAVSDSRGWSVTCTGQSGAAAGNLAPSKVLNPAESQWGH